jgi:hypothetical protein
MGSDTGTPPGQDDPPPTFEIDPANEAVLFSDGTRWFGNFGGHIGAARLKPDGVIAAAVRYFLQTRRPGRFRGISADYNLDGISYCVLGADFDPVPDPTWECWIWFRVPDGWDMFPDYTTVYVRDSDGLVWEWKEQSGKRRRIPSYEWEASPWHDKPRSRRKKKPKT